MRDEELAEKLVKAHWEYIEGLLKAHKEDTETIELVKYHYLSAGKHFFGHGVEWAQKKCIKLKKLRKNFKKIKDIQGEWNRDRKK